MILKHFLPYKYKENVPPFSGENKQKYRRWRNFMNEWIKGLLTWTQTKVEQGSHTIKEKVDQLLNKSTLSVNDLATLIMLHPESNRQRKEYLGLVFHFYRLKIGDVKLYLETKGNDSHYILECKIQDDQGVVSHYRSYERKSPDAPLKVPARLKHLEVER
jgi:hypothetical protein